MLCYGDGRPEDDGTQGDKFAADSDSERTHLDSLPLGENDGEKSVDADFGQGIKGVAGGVRANRGVESGDPTNQIRGGGFKSKVLSWMSFSGI